MRKIFLGGLLLLAGLSSAWADSRYVILGEVVHDTQTKLTWARCSVGQVWKKGHCLGDIKVFSFADAQKQAADGWRLPTHEELAGLIDHDRKTFPALEVTAFPDMEVTAFPDMEVNHPWYWSATANGDTIAWYVDFATGYSSGFITDSYPFAIRLVRNTR